MGDKDELRAIGEGRLPGLLGLLVTDAGPGQVSARIELEQHHLAPNGFLHAATVVALADTCCGYGARLSLPKGATGFTTIELKANFIATATAGAITAEASLVHGGRTTQVWDATVRSEQSGKTLALFRCTQAVLWPAAPPGGS
jgi:1,4-dihydroxy-2-naphthoyl-CoA hydrolase